MQMIRSMMVVFSMYSHIPMPQFKWTNKDMNYMFCFFPAIGVVIGICIYLWRMICDRLAIGIVCYTVVGVVIPLLITGGIHVDGFIDTMDAFHSYQSKERKLEILKDSHIGAFAVIMLVVYGLLYIGAFSEIANKNLLKIVCAGFALARCLSGISVVSFPLAKKEGLLYQFASHSKKRSVKLCLYLQGIGCMGFMLKQSFYAGSIIVIIAISSLIDYHKRCIRELGGITGDTSGYFVLICERNIVIAAAILNHLL